ncbi:MAG: GspE/PulE family protein [Candidatus Omnitrophota bacterium]|nr:GspE/PulE family protein [Candidatus Omnitrophota bacterium]
MRERIPTISLADVDVDPSVGRLIPKRVARRYTVLPIAKSGDRIQLAMADPGDIVALEDVALLTQCAVDPVQAQAADIRRLIEQVFSSQSGMPAESQGSDDDAPLAQVFEETSEAPVSKAINLMIAEALRRRASDIHLEPMAEGFRLRYRIDGQLREIYQLPKSIQNTMLTRLKIMAGLDITEWRQPQDGRFKLRVDNRDEVDFRVSVLPVAEGNKVVLRVLNRSNLSKGLDHLGFLPDSIAVFKEAVQRPHGMILVTGPTGSGKSTTMYCILNQLNTPTRNLITIEDPVEYQLPRVTQVQVNPEIGLTFASGLRSLLRQTPDVVMIGEIRDFETADIAMKASLTGQLVLSTLHTNDAPSAVTRLVDMGVEPFLIASSVTLIQAQRLVRTLCTSCREPVEPPTALLKRSGMRAEGTATFFRAKGCHACFETGYRGRLGIIEVMPIDERIQDLVVTKASSWEIKQHAVRSLGMRTLRQDGLRKAAMGLTTVDDVLATTTED